MTQRTNQYFKDKFAPGYQLESSVMDDMMDSLVNVSDVILSKFGINITAAGYNGIPDGTTDNSSAILAANAALVALGGGTIYFPVTSAGVTYRVNGDVALSDLVQLHFDKGAKFSIDGGRTVSNIDLIFPPSTQIFAGNGTATLKAGNLHRPEWWGAVRNGVTDDYTAINKARVSLETSGGDMLFSKGTYIVGTNLTFAISVRLLFTKGAILSPNTGITISFHYFDAPEAQVFAGLGVIQLNKYPKGGILSEWWGAIPDGSTACLTAINAAIVCANTFHLSTAYGAKVKFLHGVYLVSTTLTRPSPNVTLEGIETKGGNGNNPASIIKLSDTTVALIDLGSSLTNGVTIRYLGLFGSGGTNLAHRGITSANTSFTVIEHCFINDFGGNAIRIDAGNDNHIDDNLVTNCMLGHAALAAYAGVIELGCSETFGEGNNFNGAGADFLNKHGDVDGVAGVIGSGFLCVLYVKSNLCHFKRTTFAFAHYGVRINFTQLHEFESCRFEYNQRNGVYTDGIKSRFINNRFQDNSQELDNAYNHFRIGSNGVTGYQNSVIGNQFWAISHPTYLPNYGIEINTQLGGEVWASRNRVEANDGDGFELDLLTYTGVQPLLLGADYREQLLSVAGAATAQFKAQQGLNWKLTLTGSTATLDAPLRPVRGQIAMLEVLNSSGGASILTFNAVFKHIGYTDPASTKRKTAVFRFDGTNWMLQGAWSADI